MKFQKIDFIHWFSIKNYKVSNALDDVDGKDKNQKLQKKEKKQINHGESDRV